MPDDAISLFSDISWAAFTDRRRSRLDQLILDVDRTGRTQSSLEHRAAAILDTLPIDVPHCLPEDMRVEQRSITTPAPLQESIGQNYGDLPGAPSPGIHFSIILPFSGNPELLGVTPAAPPPGRPPRFAISDHRLRQSHEFHFTLVPTTLDRLPGEQFAALDAWLQALGRSAAQLRMEERDHVILALAQRFGSDSRGSV